MQHLSPSGFAKVALISIIPLFILMWPSAYAHWDAPGDPAHITVILKRIDYNEDADDYEDSFSGADLVIGWRAELSGHDLATNTGTITRENISLSEGSNLRLDLNILDHDECTPLGDLRLFVWAAESDRDDTLDTNRAMRQVVQNGDLSTGPVEAQRQFESAGDQWIGFGTKVSRGSLAEGVHLEGEMEIPMDEGGKLDAEFLIERDSVRNTGQCTQTEQRTSMVIPDWIRQNAAWWSDGTITDRDFASAIGFLVKEGIISINVPTNKDGTILVNDNLQIPDWLRNNAKWWSEGIITDSDFTSGIEYMVKQKIISFSEKKPAKKQSDDYVLRVHYIVTMILANPTYNEDNQDKFAMEALNTIKSELTADEYELLMQYVDSEARGMRDTVVPTLRDDSPITDMERARMLINLFGQQSLGSFDTSADQSKSLYLVSKQNEAISDSLIQINQYEKQVFRDAIDDAWERFDETKNPIDMKMAQNLDKALKGVEKRIQTIQKTASIAKQDTKNIIKSAESQGIKKLDLEKAAKDKTSLKIRLSNNDDLGKALGQVEVASKQNIKDLDKALNLPKGKMVDDLIFGHDTKPSGQGTTVKPLDVKPSGDSTKSFGQYYDLSDHIPVKAVFENWENLQQTKTDAQTIKEIDHGTNPTDSEQKAVTTETKTEPVENEEPVETQSGKQVSVLVIGGKYYPQSQFHVVEAHTPNCDSLHYHSPYPSVRSTDGTTISDPSPSTCGFGKVGLIAVDVVTMTQEQIDAFKEVMGFEP